MKYNPHESGAFFLNEHGTIQNCLQGSAQYCFALSLIPNLIFLEYKKKLAMPSRSQSR